MFAAPPFINLIVLRSPDIDRASEFYSNFDGHTVELLTPPNRDKVVSSEEASTDVTTVTHADGMNPGDADRQ